jgi:predicted phosphodiesterase
MTEKIENPKKNISVKLLLAAGIVIFLTVSIFAGYRFLQKKSVAETLKIGAISDIHASQQKMRTDPSEPRNIVLPANFEKNLEAALQGTRDCDFTLILGDNSYNNTEKYIAKLRELTMDYPILWVKGNHDQAEIFKILSENNYYYIDKNNWRIIVLDNSTFVPEELKNTEEAFSDRGWIGPEQLAWLKDSLQTEKQVLISMHVPIFQETDIDSLRPEQAELEKIFREAGNVKHVVFGHFHIYDQTLKKDGIQYHFISSVSLENYEGHYAIIDLKQSSKEILFSFFNKWLEKLDFKNFRL